MEYKNPKEGFEVSFRLPSSSDEDNKSDLSRADLLRLVAEDTEEIRHKFMVELYKAYILRCKNPELLKVFK